jgi:hypothetical protein
MGEVSAALEWRNRAFQSGHNNWKAIRNDPYLANIRSSAGFKDLIKDR